ncbi:MAG TPA: hypothetical protein PLK99_10120, partial [Burkholderiales bacterium]|nr:hypothetical protein [Burkholderiales bacterium]
MVEFPNGLFIDPTTKDSLHIKSSENKAIAADGYYQIENGVIDFYKQLKFESDRTGSSASNAITDGHKASFAPELRDAHDRAFEASHDSGGNI